MADEIDEQDDGDDAGDVTGKWSHVPTAHTEQHVNHSLTSREVRAVLSKMTAAVSIGVSLTSNAKYLALAGVGGAAVLGAGTAGIGLAVAGGVMTAVGVGTSAASAYKTNRHIDNLRLIHADGRGKGKFACRCISQYATPDMANDHEMIHATVLPYIIAKKRAKLGKKAAGTAGLSLATTVHRLGKAAYKGIKGTKGVNRSFNAHVLVRHALTHECWLAEAIISELFSPTDYIAIMNMSSEYAGPLVAGKMKSI
ncbi:MAG: hypothetical protein PGN09_12415 [Sphingomonas fennica]